jgi:hypothetical protein
MSVSKSIKQAQLYPLKRKDKDEDDIQEVQHKKPRSVPQSVAKKAQHVLPGAKFEDKGSSKSAKGDKDGKADAKGADPGDDKDKPPGGLGKRKREQDADKELSDPRSSRASKVYGRIHGDYVRPPPEPKPWEELMTELTSYYTKSGPDYNVFPFPILKCSDYSWLVMGKRRTGKTTLYAFFAVLAA